MSESVWSGVQVAPSCPLGRGPEIVQIVEKASSAWVRLAAFNLYPEVLRLIVVQATRCSYVSHRPERLLFLTDCARLIDPDTNHSTNFIVNIFCGVTQTRVDLEVKNIFHQQLYFFFIHHHAGTKMAGFRIRKPRRMEEHNC